MCSDNFANYVFIWQGYYFTYHITSKLIIEKMSRYMRWKKIEENPPANKCIKNKISLTLQSKNGKILVSDQLTRHKTGSFFVRPCQLSLTCLSPAVPPCPAFRPWPGAAIKSPVWPSIQPGIEF